MKALQKGAGLVAAVAVLFAAGVTGANHASLDMPEISSCNIDGDALTVTWNSVEGADKYSLEVTGFITLGEDTELGVGQHIYSWDVGVPGSEDANVTATVPLADLFFQGDETTYHPDYLALVRVKALDPGKGRGHQNHNFSESCELPAQE